MGLGVLCWANILDLSLPVPRFRYDSWLEHQGSADHTTQKRRGEKDKTDTKQTDKTSIQMIKAKLNRQKHTNKHTHRHSQKSK